MPKKRKSRGRRKGSKGSGRMVQCHGCGKIVPMDKVKKVSKRVSFIEPSLAKELRKQGAYIAGGTTIRYFCVSCGVHRGLCSPRAKGKRKTVTRKRK